MDSNNTNANQEIADHAALSRPVVEFEPTTSSAVDRIKQIFLLKY